MALRPSISGRYCFSIMLNCSLSVERIMFVIFRIETNNQDLSDLIWVSTLTTYAGPLYPEETESNFNDYSTCIH